MHKLEKNQTISLLSLVSQPSWLVHWHHLSVPPFQAELNEHSGATTDERDAEMAARLDGDA